MRAIFASPWFGRGMRLSVVVGLAGGGWHAWSVWERYQEDLTRSINSELTYRCAARLSEEQLRPHMNAVGNINVRTLCLTRDDFYVSLPELEEVRKDTMKFEPIWKPFDWPGTAIVGAMWTVGTILATIALLGVAATFRWVWGRPQ